jgi:carbamoyltransferase
MSLKVIGISAFYHDSACCLMIDGEIVAAAQEERFSRIKNDPNFPIKALRFCLEQKRLSITDIDCIAYYENPVKKLSRQLYSGSIPSLQSLSDPRFRPGRAEEEIRNRLGFEGPIRFYHHHLSHAASSFYFSGFPEASIMTMDGVGEWATASYGYGNNSGIHTIKEIDFPDSVGLFYSTVTSYLGFEVNEGEYKVMGLAPYGVPKYKKQLQNVIQSREGFNFILNMEYFDFLNGATMFSPALCDLLQAEPRKRHTELTQFHKDVACSAQKVLEDLLIEKSEFLYSHTGIDALCMSGGVALNCVANSILLRKGTFKKIFVPPGSNDSGCAVGAAALGTHDLSSGQLPPRAQISNCHWGPQFSVTVIRELLNDAGLRYDDFSDNPAELLRKSAALLADGKVVGWFQGRMEFGPRALGSRSILADPRDPSMQKRINAMVKKREGFRPFAPSALEESAPSYFEIDHPSPFMLETCQVISPIPLPAITHVDGSARLQTVSKRSNEKYYDLLKEFETQTGCPILLNTSFNVNKEPIVCTPSDAIRGFIRSNIDALVVEDFIIEREKNEIDAVQYSMQSSTSIRTGVVESLYTFI